MTPEQQTPTWRLFHMRYRFKLPYVHFHDDETLRTMGQVVTGDRHFDRGQLDDLVTTEDTPARMAIHFDNGVRLVLDNLKDTVDIYSDIQAYLAGWQRAAQMEYNLGEVPREWIARFEDMAIALKPLVDQYRAANPSAKRTSKFLGQRTLFTPLAKDEPRVEQTTPAATKPTHPAIDVINEHLYRRGLLDKE